MKMIRASSSKPPMMLPIRIQSEMGIARPLRTSSIVYKQMKGEFRESKCCSHSVTLNLSVALPPSTLFLSPEWWGWSPELRGDRHLLSSLTYIWPTDRNTEAMTNDFVTELKKWAEMIMLCLFVLLFWKSHHELCGWHEWLQPALSEAAGRHTQPQCTMTCCSSRHADINTVQHINIYADAAHCLVSAVLCCQESHQYVAVHHVFRMKRAYISLSGLQLGQITHHTAVHPCGL